MLCRWLWLSGARGAELRQQMERNAALGPVSRVNLGLVISVLFVIIGINFPAGCWRRSIAPGCRRRWGSRRAPARPCGQRCWLSPRVPAAHPCERLRVATLLSPRRRGRVLVGARGCRRAARPGIRGRYGAGASDRAPPRCWRWRNGRLAPQLSPMGCFNFSNSLK